MAKSNLQSGLDAILGGSADVEEAKKQSENTTVCFRCSPDRIAKVRKIAHVKNVSLKDVLEAAIDLAVAKYEKNNGVIVLEEEKVVNASNIFD